MILLKLAHRMNALYPNDYFPLHTMVSFINIAYSMAFQNRNAQEKRIQQFIRDNDITIHHSDEQIDLFIHQLMKK